MFGLFKKKSKQQETTSSSNNSKSTPPQKKLDLMKNRLNLIKKISLEKGISETTTSRVALVLDFSGSMRSLYQNGFVQRLVERLFPMGLRFDDNNAIDVFLFHNSSYELGEVTEGNFEGYVDREIIEKYSMGGTNYSPVIKRITEKYSSEKGDPAYVMFITDGDNFDKQESTEAIKNAAKHGIFWQFIGIGSDNFSYLEKLDDLKGRVIDNANFFCARKFDKMTDEELYGKMMGEYPDYLIEAKKKGII